MESTIKPALVLMSGRAIAFAATLFLPLALVRIFDQAEFGTYKQLFLVYATLYGISQFAMAESLYYFLPRAPREGGSYVANSMLSLAAAGLAGLGLLWGSQALRWRAGSATPPSRRTCRCFGLFLMLMIPTHALEVAMIARHRYAWGSASYGISTWRERWPCCCPRWCGGGRLAADRGDRVPAFRLGGHRLYFRP